MLMFFGFKWCVLNKYCSASDHPLAINSWICVIVFSVTCCLLKTPERTKNCKNPVNPHNSDCVEPLVVKWIHYSWSYNFSGGKSPRVGGFVFMMTVSNHWSDLEKWKVSLSHKLAVWWLWRLMVSIVRNKDLVDSVLWAQFVTMDETTYFSLL